MRAILTKPIPGPLDVGMGAETIWPARARVIENPTTNIRIPAATRRRVHVKFEIISGLPLVKRTTLLFYQWRILNPLTGTPDPHLGQRKSILMTTVAYATKIIKNVEYRQG